MSNLDDNVKACLQPVRCVCGSSCARRARPVRSASAGGCAGGGAVHGGGLACERQHAGYLRALRLFQGIMNGYKKIFCLPSA